MATDFTALINALPETLPPDPTRLAKINHAGKVDRQVSNVLTGLSAGIATAAVILRLILQRRNRGRLYIDDYLILFATVCLLGETVTLYHKLDMLYVEASLAENPMNIVLFTRGQVKQLLDEMLTWTNVYMSFAWTTNYMIKFSFLAFFRPLVKNVSRSLNTYWWFTLWFTIASWLFNLIQNFIICGASNDLRCFPYPRFILAIGTSCTAADVITDLMIVSIPILLLRKTQLRLSHKLRILTFLCLSTVMVIMAITRYAGGLYRDRTGILTWDMVWIDVWMHIESSVAVLMGGVTAFRTVFAKQDDESRREKKRSSSSIHAYVRRLLGRSKATDGSGNTDLSGKEERKRPYLAGPQTGGTLKGLRTFIRRNGRQTGHTTIDVDPVDSSMYDPLESYHNFKRSEERSAKASNGTGKSQNSEDYDLPEFPLPVLQTHNMV